MKIWKLVLAIMASASLVFGGAPALAANDGTQTPASSSHLDVYGVTLDWNPESFWAPAGCSTFDFSYRNGSGIRLLSIEFEILSQFGDKVGWDSEVGVDPGISGTWSEQICASDLTDGLGPYKLRLLIEDYASQSRSVETGLTFKARPAVIKNLRAAPTNKQARVTWSYLANAEGYEIRITYSNNVKRYGAWTQIDSGYSSSFIWTGLRGKTTYKVQVRAVTPFGYGDPSTVTFKTK